MKIKKSSSFLLLLTVVLVLGSCKKDDNGDDSDVLQSKMYDLKAVDGSNITGTATFTEDIDGTTTVLIKLEGSNTTEHPAFIRYNDAAQGGDVAITLKECTCSVSETVVSELDNGESINFDGLLQLDGHITIHESPHDLETIVSVANIGLNE